jgi:hypothetical protein
MDESGLKVSSIYTRIVSKVQKFSSVLMIPFITNTKSNLNLKDAEEIANSNSRAVKPGSMESRSLDDSQTFGCYG